MSMLVGFESARIGIYNSFDDEHIAADKLFTVNATKGGTMGANIQNLNYTPTVQYASDTAYRVSGKGHGAVTCAFTAQDIPPEIMSEITGEVKDANGIYTIGKDTVAPYCSLELISHDANNKKVYLALLKGQFGFPDRNPQTNQAQETDFTDNLTFTAIDRKSDGLVYAEAFEADETFTADNWDKLVFPLSQSEPSAPGLAVTAEDGALGYTITPPEDDGGAEVTGYKILYKTTAGTENWTPVTISDPQQLTGHISGLTNDTEYQVKAIAINIVGNSPESEVATGTPVA